MLFAWLVTMQLAESPARVGFAQMAFLLPTTLLILLGGGLADRYSARRQLIVAQALALLPMAGLLLLLLTDALTFFSLLVYAVCMGVVQAFVTPARDSLLNRIAGEQVQRTVVLTSLVQFGVQMLGFASAALADHAGPALLVATQIVALLIGVVAFSYVPAAAPAPARAVFSLRELLHELIRDLRQGATTVWQSGPMRAVVLLMVALGVFFMGSFMVVMPLLVRTHYSSAAADLAMINGANGLGLFLMLLALLVFGTLARPGRALLLGLGVGALVLSLGGLPFGYGGFVAVIFVWGLCGGIAMSMSRTVMQELAPPGQRGRVMSLYSFAMMGAGPIGALWGGLLCEWADPRIVLATNGLLMLLVTALLAGQGGLARLVPNGSAGP